MIHSLPRPHAAATLLHDEPEVAQSVTCPMCHTPASVTQSALDAGGWRCVRCGQPWNAARLAAVAAYAAWVLDRALADSLMIFDRTQNAAHDRHPTTERLDGTP